MGVYIKSMEMPKNCMLCPFCVEEADPANGEMCMVTGKLMPPCNRERLDDCPLVHVPPHGRMIDADALENEAQIRLLECNKYDNQFQKPYEVMREIALAPTIIESEGE